jgi:membrane-associated progesterone receptor component
MHRRRTALAALAVAATVSGLAPALRVSRARRPPPRSTTAVRADLLFAAEVVTGTALAGMMYTVLNEGKDKEEAAKRKAEEAARLELRRMRASIEPKDSWTAAELAAYDGTDYDGPILLGADGLVFNVWKGRHFYAPDGPYHAMAGKDASRQLAKNRLDDDEDYPEDDGKPLTLAE